MSTGGGQPASAEGFRPERPEGAAWRPPEASVAQGPRPAGVGRRVFAGFIDALLLSALLVGFLALFGIDDEPDGAFYFYVTLGDDTIGLAGATFLLYVVACFAGLIAFEAFRGQTPGKIALGLRVTRDQGGRISFGQAVGRNLLRVVDGIIYPFYLVGIVVAASTTRNQRVGDLAARTVVVRER